MNIWLDDQQIPATAPTLAAALDAARNAAHAAGRVIIEADWDGQIIPDDLLESPSSEPISAKDLRFVTADPRALVSTTMHEMADVVEQALHVQQETADALRSGRMEEAFANLSETIAVWDTVRRAVQEGPTLVGVGITSITIPAAGAGGERESVVSHIGRLSDLMSDVKSALQNEDWSTLGDLLADDMDVQGKRWIGILRSLAVELGPKK